MHGARTARGRAAQIEAIRVRARRAGRKLGENDAHNVRYELSFADGVTDVGGDLHHEGLEVKLDKSRRMIDSEWCKELAPRGTYFTVSYQKGGVNLPEMETLVYLGSTQLEDDGELKIGFLFQLANSCQSGWRLDGPVG